MKLQIDINFRKKKQLKQELERLIDLYRTWYLGTWHRFKDPLLTESQRSFYHGEYLAEFGNYYYLKELLKKYFKEKN